MKAGRYFTVSFELGNVVVHTDARGRVSGVTFDLERRLAERPSRSRAAGEIAAYLRGRHGSPGVVPDLSAEGPFRKKVYQRVLKIPFGQTASYGEIAADVGCPGGARAVGQAMARNRYPLLIPCHRVISSGGELGGFSSGLPLKRYLLRLEGLAY